MWDHPPLGSAVTLGHSEASPSRRGFSFSTHPDIADVLPNGEHHCTAALKNPFLFGLGYRHHARQRPFFSQPPSFIKEVAMLSAGGKWSFPFCHIPSLIFQNVNLFSMMPPAWAVYSVFLL